LFTLVLFYSFSLLFIEQFTEYQQPDFLKSYGKIILYNSVKK
jgi:hypothetical protein